MNFQKVSILVPVYNRETLIEESVHSALNQTYKNIEVIVVDNKSTDKTWDILNKLAREDDRIKIFQNETNIGPVRNWKRCIDEASGVYGKILWSDDLIMPDFIEKTLPFFDNLDVGFVFTKVNIFSDTNAAIYYDLGKTGLYDASLYINKILSDYENIAMPVSPGCALFRLEDLKNNLLINIPNPINSDFSQHAIGNDLVLLLLTAVNYKKIGYQSEVLSHFRSHADSISIKSEDGKLFFMYSLAKAFFVENYYKSKVPIFNSTLKALLFKYKKK
jgi:glycosyltransferase involved in cell wall biosynthesis